MQHRPRNWWTSIVEFVRQQAGVLAHVVRQCTDCLELGDRAQFRVGRDEFVHRNQSDCRRYLRKNGAETVQD